MTTETYENDNQAGYKLFCQGKYRESIQKFESAIKPKPDYGDAWYNKARAHQELREHYEALRSLEKAINLDIQNIADAWYYKGKILFDLRRFVKAQKAFKKAIVLKSNYTIEAHYYEGRALFELKRYNEALYKYKVALKMDPYNFEVCYYKALVLKELEKYTELGEDSQEIREFVSKNKAKILYIKGIILHKLGKYSECLTAFEKSIILNSNYSNKLYKKGFAFLNYKNKKEDENSLNSVITQSSKSASNTLYMQGLAFLELNDFKQALFSFEKAIDLNPKNGSLLYYKGYTLYKIRNYLGQQCMHDDILFEESEVSKDALDSLNEATFHLRESQCSYPNDVEAYYYEALVCQLIGEIKKLQGNLEVSELKQAENKFNKLILKNFENTKSNFYKGLSYMELGNYNCAKETFLNDNSPPKNIGSIRGLFDGNLNFSRKHYYIGLCLDKLGQKEEAASEFELSIQFLEKCININSKVPETYYLAGKIYKQVNSLTAKTSFEMSVILSLKNVSEAFSYTSSAYKELDDRDKSLKWGKKNLGICKEILDLFEDFEIWYLQGKILEDSVKPESIENPEDIEKLENIEIYKNALNCFNKSVELNPSYYLAWEHMGHIYFLQNNLCESISCFDKAIKINPRYDTALYNKGYALAQVRDYVKALEAIEKAIDINPKLNTLNFKGIVLFCLGKEKESIKTFYKLTKTDPKNDIFWFNKGLVHYFTKKYDDAIEAFEKIRDIQNNLDALNFKGLIYSFRGESLRAKKIFEEVIRINKDDASAHANLAELYLSLGDINNASREVDEGLRANNKSPIIWNLKGQIYIEKKNYITAISCFENAISFDQTNPIPLIWTAYAKYLNAEFFFSLDDMNSTVQGDEGENKLENNIKFQEEILSIIRDLEKVNIFLLKEEKYNQSYKRLRAYNLYLLGYFYYKGKDLNKASRRLQECVKLYKSDYICNLPDKIKKPQNYPQKKIENSVCIDISAKDLLNYIWNYKMDITLFRWWLFSPINNLLKRVIFSAILMCIFLIFVNHPIIEPFLPEPLLISTINWDIYNNEYLAVISFLVLCLLFPFIRLISAKFLGQEFEFEIKSPPTKFELCPYVITQIIKIMENNIL